MFKHVWILILVGLYVLWGYSAVKDIIDTLKDRSFDNILELWDDLDPSSGAFIGFTLIALASFSFVYWIYCITTGG